MVRGGAKQRQEGVVRGGAKQRQAGVVRGGAKQSGTVNLVSTGSKGLVTNLVVCYL